MTKDEFAVSFGEGLRQMKEMPGWDLPCHCDPDGVLVERNGQSWGCCVQHSPENEYFIVPAGRAWTEPIDDIFEDFETWLAVVDVMLT